MPKITINLPLEVNEKLKKYAKEDDRSLTKYIERALKFIADHPYYTPGPVPTPPISYPYTITATTAAAATAGLSQPTQPSTTQPQFIDTTAIPEGATIKYTRPQVQAQTQTLSEEEQILKQQKLDIQQAKIRQQRIKLLKERCMSVFGSLLPYLENNDQKTIDFVLNKYKTDEEIMQYLLDVKKEDEEYDCNDYDEEDDAPPEPDNDYYKRIKHYYSTHFEPFEFEDLITHATVRTPDSVQYIKDYHQLQLFDALDIPHSHTWTDDEWTEIFDLLTKI